MAGEQKPSLCHSWSIVSSRHCLALKESLQSKSWVLDQTSPITGVTSTGLGPHPVLNQFLPPRLTQGAPNKNPTSCKLLNPFGICQSIGILLAGSEQGHLQTGVIWDVNLCQNQKDHTGLMISSYFSSPASSKTKPHLHCSFDVYQLSIWG